MKKQKVIPKPRCILCLETKENHRKTTVCKYIVSWQYMAFRVKGTWYLPKSIVGRIDKIYQPLYFKNVLIQHKIKISKKFMEHTAKKFKTLTKDLLEYYEKKGYI